MVVELPGAVLEEEVGAGDSGAGRSRWQWSGIGQWSMSEQGAAEHLQGAGTGGKVTLHAYT